MSEWAVCPQCQLKHRRRPDGACPRCQAHVGDGGAEPLEGVGGPPTARPFPEASDGHESTGSILTAAAAPASLPLSLGARIGGAILVANGLAVMIEQGLSVTTPAGDAPAAFQATPISMLIDLVLGGMLLMGNPKALPWTKVRVVLGGLLIPVIFFVAGNNLMACLQLAFSGGMALLLFGDAGRLRIGLGLTSAACVLALETIGLLGAATGISPLASLQLASSIDGDPVETVDGVAYPWRVTASGGHWYLRDAEIVQRDNPLADRWLVWPVKDAHVIVIAENAQVAAVDMDKFAQVVLNNARRSAPDMKVIAREPLHAGGTLIHATGTVNGIAIEYYYGLFASEPWIFQLVAFTGQERFESVRSDFRSIIDSFEAPAR